MEPITAGLSFIIASAILFRVYRYFYLAAALNDEQHDTAHTKEFGEDTIDSLINGIGYNRQSSAKYHFITTAFMLMIPIFLSSILAVGIYFVFLLVGLPALITRF